MCGAPPFFARQMSADHAAQRPFTRRRPCTGVWASASAVAATGRPALAAAALRQEAAAHIHEAGPCQRAHILRRVRQAGRRSSGDAAQRLRRSQILTVPDAFVEPSTACTIVSKADAVLTSLPCHPEVICCQTRVPSAQPTNCCVAHANKNLCAHDPDDMDMPRTGQFMQTVIWLLPPHHRAVSLHTACCAG